MNMIRTIVGYLVLIVICIMGAIRSRRIIFQWLCLEINILCIIPILCGNITKRSVENGVKYFVSQRRASLVFFVGLILMKKIRWRGLLRGAAILFKIGIPPFQS